MNFGDGTPGSSPRANVRRSCEARKRWTRSTGSSATRLRYSLGATQMGNYSRRTAPLQCPDHPRRLHATPISSLDRHRPRPTRRHGRRVIACRCPPFFACRSRAWRAFRRTPGARGGVRARCRWPTGGPGGAWLRTGGGCRCRGQGLVRGVLGSRAAWDCRYRTGPGVGPAGRCRVLSCRF
jgi:hypothetical protein